jgi:hypothetical protein
MWLVVHKGTGIVVSSASTRAKAYTQLKAQTGISDERYRVEKI